MHALLESPLPDIEFPTLHEELNSSRKVALARMEALDAESDLASPLVSLMKDATNSWLKSLSGERSNIFQIAYTEETKTLLDVLGLHLMLTKLDRTLAEELAKSGSHFELSRIIKVDLLSIVSTEDRNIFEQEEDSLTEIQDLACEIAYGQQLPFPVNMSHFTRDELLGRLPLTFNISAPSDLVEVGDEINLLIHQVTERQSAQDDVGFVMWPSAVLLSSWLMIHREKLQNKSILELGSGCGLTGLVAAHIIGVHRKNSCQNLAMLEEEKKHDEGNTASVILTDFNKKVLANIDRNIDLNGLGHVATTSHLDFYAHEGDNFHGGWNGGEKPEDDRIKNEDWERMMPPVDLIIAADVICKPSDAVAVSKTIYDALTPGGEAIIVSADAKHRFGVDIFEEECQKVGLQIFVVDANDLCGGKLLPQCAHDDDPCGIRQTSGFVEGMSLTMFTLRKPIDAIKC